MTTWDLRQYGETKEGYQEKVSRRLESTDKEGSKNTKEIKGNDSDLIIE